MRSPLTASSNMVTVNDANLLDLTTAMTLEAWVYPTVAPSGWRAIIAKEQAGGVAYYLHGSSSSTTGPPLESILAVLSASLWWQPPECQYVDAPGCHLRRHDAANLRERRSGGQSSTDGSIQTSASPLRIGGNSVFGEFFQGRIDEVRIYNRVLSQAEIQNDMNDADHSLKIVAGSVAGSR